jgi:hypothetical protein
MTARRPTTVQLTDFETGVLLGLVRQGLRKESRNRVNLVGKYGDEARLAATEQRRALLEGLYRKLGGDPAQITNRVN